MASSSSSNQVNKEVSMQIDYGESLQIKGRTMKLEEWKLTVQVENPVDFVSLTRNKCDLTSFLRYQDLSGYFTMLDGPTYENMVKHFWVRAEIYDKYAAKAEKDHLVLLDPSLEGKPRAEMGIKEFTRTEIHSSIMEIPVTITEEVIGRACRRNVEGAFQWDLKQTSSWKPIVIQTLFKGNAKGKYADMEKEHKMFQKLMQECFIPK